VTVSKADPKKDANGGGCGCSASDNNASIALFGFLGLAMVAGRRRRRV
jgi:MYXO-CTERM domain-containing protein